MNYGVSSLPLWEQTTYWLLEVLTIMYMFWSLFCASDIAWRSNESLIKLDDGWVSLNRPKDTADFEWYFWSIYFWRVLPWLCGHIVLSQTLQLIFSRRAWCIFLTIYGMLCLSHLFGAWTLLILCLQPVVMHLASRLESTVCVWISGLIFLTFLNYGSNSFIYWLFNPNKCEDLNSWRFLLLYIWGNLCQRSTSFALESVWSRQNQHNAQPSILKNSEWRLNRTTEHLNSVNKTNVHDQSYSFSRIHADKLKNSKSVNVPETPGWLDMFCYVFYLPLFFTGPIMIYNIFYKQLYDPHPITKQRIKNILFRLLRIIFWATINNVLLHYFYAHTINTNILILEKENRWVLVAIGYFMGQFFMLKYVVIFGLPAQVARIDGFEPPDVPACISYIYCYTDMWKSFDRGLHDFMKRYIFIPCGGSRAGISRQLMGSALCFIYVFYWHGAYDYLFLWCALNFIEACLEKLGAYFEDNQHVQKLYNKISPASVRRIHAVASVPIFIISIFSIFYFFGGAEIGTVYVQKLLVDIPWWSFFVFLFLMYCAMQNSIEVKRLGLTKLSQSSISGF